MTLERQLEGLKFTLMNMGLNEYQASALSHLVFLGETKATTLSRACGVPNARIYGILDELSKMGLISIRPGRPALYSPMTPEDISSALVAEARNEIRKRLDKIEAYNKDFRVAAKGVFLKAKKSIERIPLLRIVSVGEVSLEETKKLYRGSEETILILTRAMEYYKEVAMDLKDVASRGVEIRIIMMSNKNLKKADQKKRDEIIRMLNDDLEKMAKIHLSDEVIIRGCIVDPSLIGRALFLVEEVGVPLFLREAAITSHPGVVKGLASMFDLMWRYDSVLLS